jgi:hypothetical protein
VAAQLGYCGLDRQRRPLNGDEIRGCWEAAILAPDAPEPARSRPRPATASLDLERTAVRRLEFVEVGATLDDEPEHRLRRRKPATAVAVSRAAPPTREDQDVPTAVATLAPSGAPLPERIRPQQGSTEPRWSLWSDGEI